MSNFYCHFLTPFEKNGILSTKYAIVICPVLIRNLASINFFFIHITIFRKNFR